jgi:dTDP-4-amino-4,6-dideoxygalactose transaminase
MATWNAYYDALKPFEAEGKICLPNIPGYSEHNAHLFYVIFEGSNMRNTIMEDLKNKGILALFHYVQLHSFSMGIFLGNREGDLPVTGDLSKKLLRLLLYAGMTNEEITHILKNLIEKIEYWESFNENSNQMTNF